MGTKYVEQLELADLKMAFAETIREEYGTSIARQTAQWKRFWSKLSTKCSIVERI